MVEGCAISEDLITCTSCAHSSATWTHRLIGQYDNFLRCNRLMTGEQKMDVVTGKVVDDRRHPFCSSARGSFGECKVEAIYWTPKHKRDLFKLLKRV